VVANRRSRSTVSRRVRRGFELLLELAATAVRGALPALGVTEAFLAVALCRRVAGQRAVDLALLAFELCDGRADGRLQRVAALDRRSKLVLGLGHPRRRVGVLGLRRGHVLSRAHARLLSPLAPRERRPQRGERLPQATERRLDLCQLGCAGRQAEIGGVGAKRVRGVLLDGVRLLLAGLGAVEPLRCRGELRCRGGQRAVGVADRRVGRQLCPFALQLRLAPGQLAELSLDRGEIGALRSGALM